MNKEDIKKILDKFDKVLENYELDKKWGQMSVDSICHLFPSEMITIKDYITNLQEENERLKEILKWKQNRESELFTIESVLETNKQLYDERNIYKSRIDKAIEYIKDNVAVFAFGNKDLPHWEFDDYNIRDLLNILNGDI